MISQKGVDSSNEFFFWIVFLRLLEMYRKNNLEGVETSE